jgi:hypothetical protein
MTSRTATPNPRIFPGISVTTERSPSLGPGRRPIGVTPAATLANCPRTAVAAIYRQRETGARHQPAVDAERWIAEVAARLGDRLPEVKSTISASLRDDLPELRDEALIPLAPVENHPEPTGMAPPHRIQTDPLGGES